MINYLWLILIVVAVIFAGYRDITDYPLQVEREDEVVTSFEELEDAELPLSYAFTEKSTVSISQAISAELPVDPGFKAKEPRPEAVAISIKGDGSGHTLVGTIEDADGEKFQIVSPDAILWDETTQEAIFALSDAVPTDENLDAKLDHPLTLTGIKIQQNKMSAVTKGKLILDDVAIKYGTYIPPASNVDATSWMGLLTEAVGTYSEVSITIAIGLIGIMMLWLGLMKIAEEAGLVQLLARGLKPILVWLFPGIPPDGPAMGAIVMNVAANMLGLGNAATPLGIKAMEELQKVNENKEYASNAMCMLLAMNTSSVTLIPAAIIGYRVAAGSNNIVIFLPVMIMSTLISTIVAVTAAKILEKLPIFKIPPPDPTLNADAALSAEENQEKV